MDSNNDINFRTLKRFDSSVEGILSSATQVAVYDYLADGWTKLEIEGALFVVSKQNSSNYGLIIINRLNTKNFSEVIDKSWEVSLNIPFMLYKNDKGNIRCVWFYDENDCKKVYNKLRELTNENTIKNGLEMPKVTKNPVEETLAKLGIIPTFNRESDQFLRSLMQQTNQKVTILPFKETVKESSNLKETSSPAINEIHVPLTPGNKTKTLDIKELFNINSVPTSKLESLNLEKTPSKEKDESSNFFVLTPALLKEKSKNVNDFNERQSSPPMLSSQQPDQLYRPLATSACGDTVSNFHSNKSNNLTMEQLKQTLIYLLQNDADFLHTIYKTFNQRNLK